MKFITLEELKQIADNYKFELIRNDRSTCTLKTDIEVAKGRYFHIQFTYSNESFTRFKDLYNATTFWTDDSTTNNWSRSENQIYMDYNHRINLRFFDWDENEDFDSYYNKIKKYVQDRLNEYTLKQKKDSIKLKKFEIVNEDTLGKFRDLHKNNKLIEFKEKEDKVHSYVVSISGKGSGTFYIYERPKLGKWDIKFDRLSHKAIRVDTFEEVYDIINWWINSPNFEWLSI